MSRTGSIREDIPINISGDEIIVRAMLFPLFYSSSKKNLKEPAFSPPPGKKDVSVLRHKYTTTDFCKSHGKSLQIKDNTYGGLAIFLAQSVAQVNNEHAKKISTGNCVSVTIQASPLPNLPMHADILYSSDFPDDEPKIQIRMIARELIKRALLLTDPNPEKDNWTGEQVTIETLHHELSKRMLP